MLLCCRLELIVYTSTPSTASVISERKDISYLGKILTKDVQDYLRSNEALTLFLPVDSAWDKVDPYEKLYLESEFAGDDLKRIVNMHAVAEAGVRWMDTLKDQDTCRYIPCGYLDSYTYSLLVETVDGTELTVNIVNNNSTISQANLLRPDIYASNGVIHLVSSLLIPPGTFKLTPEKYLLALKCTKFVSLLHSVNLTDIITDVDAKNTILALPDDVFSIFEDDEFPKPGTPELRKLLQYHFIPGKWSPAKLETGMLLETALEEEGLDGGRQVINVEVVTDDKKERSVRFGGANVVGEPGMYKFYSWDNSN